MRTDWFVNARFGMFIHFGLYAMAARHEWVKKYEKIPDTKYDLYFKNFDPDLFDEDKIVEKLFGGICKRLLAGP